MNGVVEGTSDVFASGVVHAGVLDSIVVSFRIASVVRAGLKDFLRDTAFFLASKIPPWQSLLLVHCRVLGPHEVWFAL